MGVLVLKMTALTRAFQRCVALVEHIPVHYRYDEDNQCFVLAPIAAQRRSSVSPDKGQRRGSTAAKRRRYSMQDGGGGVIGEAVLGVERNAASRGGEEQRVSATLADGRTSRGLLNGSALEWEDGSVWRRTTLQESVLGEWVDASDEHYVIRVDANPGSYDPI